jgi:hypothetical protein
MLDKLFSPDAEIYFTLYRQPPPFLKLGQPRTERRLQGAAVQHFI